MDRAFLVAAAAKTAAPEANIVDLAERRHQPGVHVERSGDGSIVGLSIQFPMRASEDRLPLTRRMSQQWVAAQHLCIPFAEVAFEHCRNLILESRNSHVTGLEAFFRFISATGRLQADLPDLTSSLFTEYISWLSSKSSLAAGTRNGYLKSLKVAMRGMTGMSKHAARLPGNWRIRRNPWPGALTKRRDPLTLSVAHLHQ
jgi:hypothetical protein